MQEVLVKTRDRAYSILVGSSVFECSVGRQRLAAVLNRRRCLVISDCNVAPLYGEAVRQVLLRAGAEVAGIEVVAAGESAKSLGWAGHLYESSLAAGLDRGSLLVTLGGGVVGDLGGFVAATYLRGIEFIQWPTSLLAQVDSSVGGKVAIDLSSGKNLVGAFHQPSLVVADLRTMGSLPEPEFACGLAEVVKYGMIMDAGFFTFLDRHSVAVRARDEEIMEQVVARCCRLKARVVEEDERETGLRETLNYGHTFGHALEVLAGYGAMTHGAAISIGMSMAADLAVACGLADPGLVVEQDRLLSFFGLPLRAGVEIDPTRMLDLMRRDKKSRGRRLRLVLPLRIGQVRTIEDLDEAMVMRAMEGRCGQA